MDLLRALGRRRAEPEPVETLDVETLRARTGAPPAGEPAKPARPEEGYVRSDGRQQTQERTWRRTAGLRR